MKKQNKKMTKYSIKNSNHLMNSIHQCSHLEQRVLMGIHYALNRVKEEDYKGEKFHTVKIPTERIIDIGNIEIRNIKKTAHKLMKRGFSMDTETGGFLCGVYFPIIQYESDFTEITVNTMILPYLQKELDTYFTRYNSIEVKFLTSTHSIEMYKILKAQYELKKKDYKVPTIDITLRELKIQLGLIEVDEYRRPLKEKYKPYANFKMRVLDPVKEDLKHNSGLSFRYEELTAKKKVVALKIFIYDNTKGAKNCEEQERIRLYLKQHSKDEVAKDILDFCQIEAGNLKYYCERESYIETFVKKGFRYLSVEFQKDFYNWLEPKLFEEE